MATTVILTAGGIGSRMQNNIPKQFLTVNEIPIIIYTLQKFQENENVDRIIIACIEEWQPVLRAYSKEFNISKLKKIVNGGLTGIESIKNAFYEITEDSEDIVIIHDGNRPLVDDMIINSNIAAAQETGATTSYIDIHDGIVKVDEDLKIQKTRLKRSQVKSTQTPHAFSYKILKEIFPKIDDSEKYISLADAAVKMDYPVALVKGSELNFKITTPNDLSMFESITNARFGNVQ